MFAKGGGDRPQEAKGRAALVAVEDGGVAVLREGAEATPRGGDVGGVVGRGGEMPAPAGEKVGYEQPVQVRLRRRRRHRAMSETGE